MKESDLRQVAMLVLPNGRRPFEQWLDGIRDNQTSSRIIVGISKLQSGIGITRSLGDEILELKLDFGPGYRIYFALRGDDDVVLISGGDKNTQSKDIAKARLMWAEFKDDGLPDEYLTSWH